MAASASTKLRLGDGSLRFLSGDEASTLHDEIVNPAHGYYSGGALMEIAALTCAIATCDTYPQEQYPRILCICGPGNNGADGLIMARHFHHFGYQVEVFWPKGPRERAPFSDFVLQLAQLEIRFLECMPANLDQYNVIIDAIFGYNLKGGLREPFASIIARMASCTVPIVSIDFPSGWDCDKGKINPPGQDINPDTLISLIAPIEGTRQFSGRHHFLGGRFVPKSIEQKWGLNLPPYSGSSLYVKINGLY